jgi:ADYC domain
MDKRWFLLLGLAGALSCERPRPTTPSVVFDPECDDWGCGGNTPIVNNYPLRALHLGGERNAEGFSLEPELVGRDGARDGVVLDILEGGELVGRDSSGGRILRTRDELLGRSFQLHGPGEDGAMRSWTITIGEMAMVGLFPEPVGDPQYAYTFAYELKITPDATKQKPFLCPEREPWLRGGYGKCPHNKLGKSCPASLGDRERLDWSAEGNYAVLLRGETYDARTASVVPREDAQSWFNIACSGTALSKMKLLGYDPSPDPTSPNTRPTSPAQRQATLKMLTARYCSGRPEKAFTVEGQPLRWQNSGSWFAPLERSPGVGEVEAVWNKDGAVCLNQPRRHADDVEPIDRANVEAVCGTAPPPCAPVPAFGEVPDGAEWITAESR